MASEAQYILGYKEGFREQPERDFASEDYSDGYRDGMEELAACRRIRDEMADPLNSVARTAFRLRHNL